VSWSLYADPNHRDAADAACAYTDTTRTTNCRILADLTQGHEGTSL
jgi:hypothetical protein